jgi:probable F420-dependent oxidoreductase
MINLGRVGVWSAGLRFGDLGEAREAAVEFEELGYGALWVPGGAHAGTLDTVGDLLAVTRSIPVATGIVNIWIEDAGTTAAHDARLRTAHPGRILLGIGVSHAAVIGDRYHRPLSAVRDYLDALDAAAPPVAQDDRIVAALGPRMLDLARERSAGSHPYLSTPEHTRFARLVLGPDKLLAPEQTVVLDRNPATARATAREFLARYLALPNYVNNLRRTSQLTDADFADGGSDRLVDTAIAWGDETAIRERVHAHFQSGADHVCIQVASGGQDLSREPLRRLAPALTT